MEFLKEMLAAVGGAVGIVIVVLATFKGFLQKWVETTIDKAAEKSLVKYSNILQRKTTAYEKMLEKEFVFFECTSNFVSAVVVDIQDFVYYLGEDEKSPRQEVDAKNAMQAAKRILKSIPEYKKDQLLAQPYLTIPVRDAGTKIIKDLQEAIPAFMEAIESACEGNLSNETVDRMKAIRETTLMNCALITTRIQSRLKELSEE